MHEKSRGAGDTTVLPLLEHADCQPSNLEQLVFPLERASHADPSRLNEANTCAIQRISLPMVLTRTPVRVYCATCVRATVVPRYSPDSDGRGEALPGSLLRTPSSSVLILTLVTPMAETDALLLLPSKVSRRRVSSCDGLLL